MPFAANLNLTKVALRDKVGMFNLSEKTFSPKYNFVNWQCAHGMEWHFGGWISLYAYSQVNLKFANLLLLSKTTKVKVSGSSESKQHVNKNKPKDEIGTCH